ncbi:MAG: hypothetical protein AAGB51_09680 [Planctomycetota bacterium]
MHTKTAIASTLAALALASNSHAQVLINGSLTGPPTVGSVPTGWSVWTNTPDTVDLPGPFNNTGTPWTASPDGGTFVRGGASTATSESFSQIVTGFSVGQTYQIDFFTTNLGFYSPTSGAWIGADGYWDFHIDGAMYASSTVLSKPTASTDSIVWNTESFTFVAANAVLELGFAARLSGSGSVISYMGIDGIRLTQVPAPGISAFLGGLAMFTRRRRA